MPFWYGKSMINVVNARPRARERERDWWTSTPRRLKMVMRIQAVHSTQHSLWTILCWVSSSLVLVRLLVKGRKYFRQPNINVKVTKKTAQATTNYARSTKTLNKNNTTSQIHAADSSFTCSLACSLCWFVPLLTSIHPHKQQHTDNENNEYKMKFSWQSNLIKPLFSRSLLTLSFRRSCHLYQFRCIMLWLWL